MPLHFNITKSYCQPFGLNYNENVFVYHLRKDLAFSSGRLKENPRNKYYFVFFLKNIVNLFGISFIMFYNIVITLSKDPDFGKLPQILKGEKSWTD